ncbi:MAG: Endonuclease/exonuclease/phosphatase family [bacterium]|nr:MAG: Endonuclease/exonuclease/phosphatase family [bacterium]
MIGDGTGGCGIVEAAINLGAFSIQADGFFAIRYSAGVALLTGYDASLAGSFENSDNLTFLLVTGNTAAAANDLDTNNDGVLDLTPWTTIIDQVGILETAVVNCTTDEYLYTGTTVGPDGTFAPGHIYRCGASWLIGPFGGVLPAGGVDTVGGANTGCPVPVAPSTWSNIKARTSN